MEIHNSEMPAFEYDYIADGIYIGNNQCCQVHLDEKLKTEGITTVISLEEERLDAPSGAELHVWIPVKDHTAPEHDQFELGISILGKIIEMGKKVYVHCKNGHGRGPTLVAAYFIHKGESVEEAEKFIRSKRPTMHITDVQREALKEFAKTNLDTKTKS